MTGLKLMLKHLLNLQGGPFDFHI